MARRREEKRVIKRRSPAKDMQNAAGDRNSRGSHHWTPSSVTNLNVFWRRGAASISGWSIISLFCNIRLNCIAIPYKTNIIEDEKCFATAFDVILFPKAYDEIDRCTCTARTKYHIQYFFFVSLIVNILKVTASVWVFLNALKNKRNKFLPSLVKSVKLSLRQ